VYIFWTWWTFCECTSVYLNLVNIFLNMLMYLFEPTSLFPDLMNILLALWIYFWICETNFLNPWIFYKTSWTVFEQHEHFLVYKLYFFLPLTIVRIEHKNMKRKNNFIWICEHTFFWTCEHFWNLWIFLKSLNVPFSETMNIWSINNRQL
jgi:hypothetical protein